MWRNVTEDRTFSKWHKEIQENGVADLVEGAKRYLELENRKLGRYPCDLEGYTNDPRIVYRRLRPNSYEIFPPVDRSGGLKYMEGWDGIWKLCLQRDKCPSKYTIRECRGDRQKESPSLRQ